VTATSRLLLLTGMCNETSHTNGCRCWVKRRIGRGLAVLRQDGWMVAVESAAR